LIGFLFGFLPLGKGGGFVGAVIGTWFCFLDAKETISNPVGDEMERDRVEIRCLPSEEVPVKFTNENGKIKVFALVAT